MATVSFRLRDISVSGDHCVVLVGDCKELGEWRPEGGRRLLHDEQDAVWKNKVCFEPHAAVVVEYKYVICRKGSEEELLEHSWECGGNRRVQIEDRMVVEDSWSSREDSRVWVQDDEEGRDNSSTAVSEGTVVNSVEVENHAMDSNDDDPAVETQDVQQSTDTAAGVQETNAVQANDVSGVVGNAPSTAQGSLFPADDSLALNSSENGQPLRAEQIPTHSVSVPQFLSDRCQIWDFSQTPGEPPVGGVSHHMFFASGDDFISHAMKWLAGGLHWFVGEALANPPHHLNFIEGTRGIRLRADAFKSSSPDSAVHSPSALLNYLGKEKGVFLKPQNVLQAHNQLLRASQHEHCSAEERFVEGVINDAKTLLEHLKTVSYKNGHHLSPSVEHALKCAHDNMTSLSALCLSMRLCREKSMELNALTPTEKRNVIANCLHRCLEHLDKDEVVDIIMDALVCRLRV